MGSSSLAKRWGLSTALVAAPLLTGCSGPYSILDPAGPSAQQVTPLWWGMFTVATLVTALVAAIWCRGVARQAEQLNDAEERRVRDRWIWAGGIALPTVSVVVLLAFGIPAAHRMLPLPDAERPALRIDVDARRWYWQVRYPDHGITLIDEIHIPVDTPVDFHISSSDVIHGFWVPRLGGKLDAIPGRVNVLRLEAESPGMYGGRCAEFCGVGHAHMPFRLIAHSAADFDSWLASRQAPADEESDE